MTANPEYRLSLVFVAASAIAAAAVIGLTGMSVPFELLAAMLGFPAFFLGLHLLYGFFRPVIRLSLLAGSLALLLAAACGASLIAHVGMRFRFPLQDRALAAADRFLGIDTPGLALAFAGFPQYSEPLARLYDTTVPAVFLAAIGLSLYGKAQRVWELVLGYSAGLFICCTVSVFLPATANFVHAGLSAHELAGLPSGSGVFHMKAVHYFRDGQAMLVDAGKFAGVVTFPSFHTMMALIVAYACRGCGPLSPLAWLWAGLIIVSTIPIGGHYVIDLIAGAALWIVIVLGVRFWRDRQMRRPIASPDAAVTWTPAASVETTRKTD
jgi:membrane-associated phospholipid phosphatase